MKLSEWTNFWYHATFVLIGIVFLIGGYLAYTFAGWDTVQGRIVSENSWTGGDLTHFYNVTASYQGHLYNGIVTCDYYPINATFPLSRSLSGNILFPSKGRLLVGC